MKRVLFLMIILGSLTSSMAIFAAGPTTTGCEGGVNHGRIQGEAEGQNNENSGGGDDSPSVQTNQ